MTTIPEPCKHFVDDLRFDLCKYITKLQIRLMCGMVLHLCKVTILWLVLRRDNEILEKLDYLCKSDFFYLWEFFLRWALFLQDQVQLLSLFLEENLQFLRREAFVHRQWRRWKMKICFFSLQSVSWTSDNVLWYLQSLLDHLWCFLCQNLSKKSYFIEENQMWDSMPTALSSAT